MVDKSLLVPGAVVRIVDSWDELGYNQWQAPSGQMDHWLGQEMTIRYTPHDEDINGWYGMEEDQNERGDSGWVWQINGFAEIVSSPLMAPDWNTEPEQSDMDIFEFLTAEVMA